MLKVLLALVASFAGWLLAMWKLQRYLQMLYALYLCALGAAVLVHFGGFIHRRLFPEI